ncbi:MAG TPA: prephenate dehydrogenase/arogenate dehydrogenase family protein [Spirochaetota bacterium]|nr:prephenate dehydrogenase/arogenate dehydrogenase family protein [Spirochaetota bacterium]HOM37976.1 prephenate dehydrogenase/arogenate dehydrogenase family protein [Spirochaetota bacterium]HPQ48781.1 prephenate dehydrogenase/arogenate dehydrogenase family protein [Spirochaetota bacterium]
MKVGIIGGKGLMGKIFADFFRRNGIDTVISDKNTEISSIDVAKSSDIILISVPINVTPLVIKEVAPFVNENSLLCDLTSIKREPLSLMLKYSKSSVVGLHPLFGPGIKSLKNQVIVMCKGRGDYWYNFLKEMFEKEGAKVKESSAEEHDKMMAVIQGLTHFTFITITHVLKDLGIDIKESLEYSSPIYRLRIDMISRILNQNPSLYADISILNKETIRVIKNYIKNVKKLYKIIKSEERSSFINYFIEASNYLGDIKERAEERTNKILNIVSNLEDF